MFTARHENQGRRKSFYFESFGHWSGSHFHLLQCHRYILRGIFVLLGSALLHPLRVGWSRQTQVPCVRKHFFPISLRPIPYLRKTWEHLWRAVSQQGIRGRNWNSYKDRMSQSKAPAPVKFWTTVPEAMITSLCSMAAMASDKKKH